MYSRMKSAPLPDNEAARLAALAEYDLLDTPAEDVYDDIIRIASEICRTPISTITLVDKNRQWFKAKLRLNNTETPRDEAFCAHTILDPTEIFVVPDARVDERFFDNPSTAGQPGIVFYAGVPLTTPEGYTLGSLCVIDNRPRQLTDNQLLSLKALAKLIIAHFELRKTTARLEASQRELQKISKLAVPILTNVQTLAASHPRSDQAPHVTALQHLANALQSAATASI